MKYRKLLSLGIIGCFLISSTAFATDLGGKYVGKGGEIKSELQVKDLGNGKIKFSISTEGTVRDGMGGVCTGGIDDATASLRGNIATYKSDECTLTMHFKDNKVVIDEKNCSVYHGDQCRFDDTYSKKSVRK